MKHILTLALLAALFALPVIVLILSALAPGWRYPDLWPRQFSGDGLAYLVIHRDRILTGIATAAGFSLVTVGVTASLCLLPAAVFARHHFPGKHLMEGLILAPALVPPMSFAMGLHFTFIRLGIADTLTAVIAVLSLVSGPYMFRALTAGFTAMGTRYRQCAANLGASPAYILMHVELPLLVPALSAGGSIVFLVAFSEYFLVFLMGGGHVPSFTGTLFPLLTSSNRSLAAILTLVFLALPLLLFWITDSIVAAMYRKKGPGQC